MQDYDDQPKYTSSVSFFADNDEPLGGASDAFHGYETVSVRGEKMRLDDQVPQSSVNSRVTEAECVDISGVWTGSDCETNAPIYQQDDQAVYDEASTTRHPYEASPDPWNHPIATGLASYEQKAHFIDTGRFHDAEAEPWSMYRTSNSVFSGSESSNLGNSPAVTSTSETPYYARMADSVETLRPDPTASSDLVCHSRQVSLDSPEIQIESVSLEETDVRYLTKQ